MKIYNPATEHIAIHDLAYWTRDERTTVLNPSQISIAYCLQL